MKKKVFSVILAFALVLSSALYVLADTETLPTNVNVDISMQLKKSSASAASWDTERIKQSGTLVADFRAVLYTDSIKDALNKWYDAGLERIKAVANGDNVLEEALVSDLNNRVIDGNFTVKITYPTTMKFDEIYLASNQDMFGFNDGAKIIFHEVNRSVEDVDANTKAINIEIATNAPNDVTAPLLGGDLHEHADEYLPELIFEVDNVRVSKVGVHTVRGAMTGSTVFGIGANTNAKVNYKGVSADAELELSSTVVITESDSPGRNGGGANITVPENPSNGTTTNDVSFIIDGKYYIPDDIDRTKVVKISDVPFPQRDGYTFYGWYTTSEMTTKYDDDDTVAPGENVRLYGHWVSNVFNADDHVAYIIGYPDGTVQPLGNITRDEVATILYRLILDEVRDSIRTETNSFSDVPADRWSNRYVSTMANGNYVLGYEDGTFRPGNSITRAEFATMIVRYANGVETASENIFSDISGHWGEDYILTAAGEGWIAGYEDGTFAPDKYITRAEAMTIFNRMLIRRVDEEGIHADAKIWIDNPSDAWYFYEVEEATNSHDYTRRADGLTETWPSLIPNRDWLNI